MIAGGILGLLVASGASGDEWDSLRDSYDRALRTHAKRIAEIEGKERATSQDAIARGDKVTRGRIAGIRAVPKGDTKARNLADAAERASRGSGGLEELSRAQAVGVDLELREWGPDGPERKQLRESMGRLQQNLERSKDSVASAADIAMATANAVPESGASENVAGIEDGVKEAGDRIRARWLNQQAALERERVERERNAAQRARDVRNPL